MATTLYLTKEQRINVTNFLKWLMVNFDMELNETLFEKYTSGIGSTMHEGVNKEILDALPNEIKIDIINRLLLSFGKLRDFSLLLKLSQYLEESMIGSWSESIMIRAVIVIAQFFFYNSIRIVPNTLDKPISKYTVYLDNTTFDITNTMSSFSSQRFVRITIEDKILHKVMEYAGRPTQIDIEELLGALLCLNYKPLELYRCEYIQSSYTNMNYLDIKLTNTILQRKK